MASSIIVITYSFVIIRESASTFHICYCHFLIWTRLNKTLKILILNVETRILTNSCNCFYQNILTGLLKSPSLYISSIGTSICIQTINHIYGTHCQNMLTELFFENLSFFTLIILYMYRTHILKNCTLNIQEVRLYLVLHVSHIPQKQPGC